MSWRTQVVVVVVMVIPTRTADGRCAACCAITIIMHKKEREASLSVTYQPTNPYYLVSFLTFLLIKASRIQTSTRHQ